MKETAAAAWPPVGLMVPSAKKSLTYTPSPTLALLLPVRSSWGWDAYVHLAPHTHLTCSFTWPMARPPELWPCMHSLHLTSFYLNFDDTPQLLYPN